MVKRQETPGYVNEPLHGTLLMFRQNQLQMRKKIRFSPGWSELVMKPRFFSFLFVIEAKMRQKVGEPDGGLQIRVKVGPFQKQRSFSKPTYLHDCVIQIKEANV